MAADFDVLRSDSSPLKPPNKTMIGRIEGTPTDNHHLRVERDETKTTPLLE
jgi:hypothetical protein